MTPEEEAWLESLPRVTLDQRIYYWEWRRELERPRPIDRVRPYIWWRKEEHIVSWFEE